MKCRVGYVAQVADLRKLMEPQDRQAADRFVTRCCNKVCRVC